MITETGIIIRETGQNLKVVYNEETRHTIYFQDFDGKWQRSTAFNRLCREQRQLKTWRQNRVPQQKRPCVGAKFTRLG